jgi:hypothetical protein
MYPVFQRAAPEGLAAFKSDCMPKPKKGTSPTKVIFGEGVTSFLCMLVTV